MFRILNNNINIFVGSSPSILLVTGDWNRIPALLNLKLDTLRVRFFQADTFRYDAS